MAMNRPYRPPSYGGPSKATATTLCQKCLKRGHYSYECKASAQDRPYISRPSRTQQLFNPKLAPKLSSDVPNDLLRKKGIADEELAKAATERGRTHERNGNADEPYKKRNRSVSSYSTSSVSTISTRRSHSRSPSPPTKRPAPAPARDKSHERRKRRRSYSSSSDGYSSDDRRERRPNSSTRYKNTRRRHSSHSPAHRGRRRSRSMSSDGLRTSKMSLSRSRSRSRNARRGASRSPYRRRGDRRSRNEYATRRSTSRSLPRHNRDGLPRREPSPPRNNGHRPHVPNNGSTVPAPPRERSLSPYSKRLALTQAMNMGFSR